MQEKSLKTSTWQRVVILVVAILLVGSMIFAYMFVVLGSDPDGGGVQNADMEELQRQYKEAEADYDALVAEMSDKYFKEFSKYKSEVKAYNAASANAEGLKTRDLKEGNGRQIGEKDYDYDAYYIGWCSDGSIFDSSFNSNDNPTSLEAPLNGSKDLIAGWTEGIVGMKLGGIRQITMNSDLAYGEDREICKGEKASPLKYVVMLVERNQKLIDSNKRLQEIVSKVYYSQYSNGAMSM